ncbi:MAG: hypothetical protein QM784_09500 [Polyangiaceae bacterium]
MNLELEFLKAATELTRRQQEVDQLVAAALGRTSYQYWIRGDGRADPELEATELTHDGQWRFRFHGLEYEAQHIGDGRRVRVDFAPGGGLAFTPSGVGSFVMTSSAPWPVFEILRSALRGPVDYDYWRCVRFCDALRAHGLIGFSRPDLVEAAQRATRLESGGRKVLDRVLLDLSAEDTDLAVCDTLVVTAQGREALLNIEQVTP